MPKQITLTMSEQQARALALAVEHALLSHPSGAKSGQLQRVKEKLVEQGIDAPIVEGI